ncbi:MAG: hypothetical protein JWQ09_1793 [Segetibacter sp.]|nr:hypothetical protein [Segetibacter sp.]
MFKKILTLFAKKEIKPVVTSPQENNSTKIYIKYSYEWKEDVPERERDTTDFPSRPFCKKMMELNRLYTRYDIEKISQRLGYSVFDRCGGDDCRHIWKSNIIVSKRK